MYDEERDISVQQSVVRQNRQAELRRERDTARWQQAKKDKHDRYDSLTTLDDMHKDEFREMRKRDFFALPQTSTDGDFWRHEQELIMKEIYAKLSKYPVSSRCVESCSLGVQAIFCGSRLGI